MEQSLPVESSNRPFHAYILNFEIFFNFSLIRMLITASARSEGSNKARLTKKVNAIAWLEVREIAWQPLDMAWVEARRTSIIFSTANGPGPKFGNQCEVTV